MANGNLNWMVGFIWNIADDVLRDIFVRGKYRDVILPMIVIRRLDAVLESSKKAVLKLNDQLDESKVDNKHAALCNASENAFYNISPFTLKDLRARAKQQQLKEDFDAYLNGFSPNVQEILNKFKFHHQIPTLVEADALGSLIEKFTSNDINLSPNPVFDQNGKVRLPGLDNHAMGTIFEELIRRFNEENNEEAGEHFTPRDVVKLMANLIFLPIADKIRDATYRVYDGACGTGGMLTVAEETLQKHARAHGKDVSIHLFGQEINPETYAISKADLLLKGEGGGSDNMKFGSTLLHDEYSSNEFDFMLSNPPYGKSWKMDLERMGDKKEMNDPRFIIKHADDPEFSLITRSSDGQLLFLVNMLSKMVSDPKSPLGSRIAEVHNGSSLFTGDAGQGESNIRRWIIENDWLEAIIALPLNMFYNTGIATYIWVLTNRKPEHRKGRVQLIDATSISTPLRKNLGKKNCELSADQIKQITEMFLAFEETEQSKIFPNAAFGYWKVTVERPMRLQVELTNQEMLDELTKDCTKEGFDPLIKITKTIVDDFAQKQDLKWYEIELEFKKRAKSMNFRMTDKAVKMVRLYLTYTSESGQPLIKKIHKKGTTPDPLYGLFETTINGKLEVVEYEPDTDLRDTEQIPLLEEGGIEAFFKREVLPHVSDAWIDNKKTKIGYDISFTRYFYKPQPMRPLEEIRADILELQKETEGLLEEIIR